ncbi:transcriptional regulator [Streptomyces sp. WM6386]|uniref:transcriptional regulator n=1 Tax=Streptomyces sp. WM6386 TaxID=1415558 RepID=UPI000A6E1E1E|nr:transcriptional regulator [Streptomyces sp. WM6386]
MDVVEAWTGQNASALKRAFRDTNEGFAGRLGTSVRTVAAWSASPQLVPTVEIQRALDTLLFQAADDVKGRFALLVGSRAPSASEQVPAVRQTAAQQRLAEDRHIAAALAWLESSFTWAPRSARELVAEELAALDPRAVEAQARRFAQVSREQAAEAARRYYQAGFGQWRPYKARLAGQVLATTILTQDSWLDLEQPLSSGRGNFQFLPNLRHEKKLSRDVAEEAVRSLTESIEKGSQIVNSEIYNLTSLDIERGTISGSVGVIDFVEFALTLNLLEGELMRSIAIKESNRSPAMPIRDELLPDVAAVLDFGGRVCAGGALALTAIARPGGRSHDADYLLLIQERSGSVLNANRRLAVIPKAFHGPMADYGEDAHFSATLEREMEEELFGRTDVDSTVGDQLHADPMHPSLLSAPMRWLMDRQDSGAWRMESTAVGVNLVSGNYEFANLIVIDDEEWWVKYGGQVRANWESSGLHRYSSVDTVRLESLALDPRWSNEGLFAFTQGCRRLAQIGGQRVRMPSIELES